jgi:hypothetical protein
MRKHRQLGLSPSEHSLQHEDLYERSIYHAGWAVKRAKSGDCVGALDSLLEAEQSLANGDTELKHSGKKIATQARFNAWDRRDLARHVLLASCFRK